MPSLGGSRAVERLQRLGLDPHHRRLLQNLNEIAQGRPKSRAKSKPLIGILSQSAGPSRASLANPENITFCSMFALFALPFARDLITLPLGPRPPLIRFRFCFFRRAWQGSVASSFQN
jgi:hypothetical protein